MLLKYLTGINSYVELTPTNYCTGGNGLPEKYSVKGILTHFLISLCRSGNYMGLRSLFMCTTEA